MKNRLKKISNTFFIVGLILVLGGITYSFFNYTAFSNELITNNGEVYLKVAKDSNDLTLNNVFPETYTHAVWGSNHTLREDNIIEFTVIGKNTYEEDVYYEIDLEYGSEVQNKERIDDKYLKFELTDITDPDHVLYLLKDISFDSIDDKRIYVDTIKNTDNTKTRTYRLRVWYDEDIIISDTDSSADFRASDNSYQADNSDLDVYTYVYSSVKVKVYGDFIEKSNIFAYLKNSVEDDTTMDMFGMDSCYSMFVPLLDENNNLDYSNAVWTSSKHDLYDDVTTLFPVGFTYQESSDGSYILDDGEYKYILELGFYDKYDYLCDKYSNFATKYDELGFDLDDTLEYFGETLYAKSPNDFTLMLPYIYEISFLELSEIEMDNYRNSSDTLFSYDLTDTLKSLNTSVWMYVIPLSDSTVSNPKYEIIVGSPSIIVFPENSSLMFAPYFYDSSTFTEYYMENLENINFSNIYTGFTTSMNSMFMNCNSLESLDVSLFNTASLTNMEGMFCGIGNNIDSEIELDISNFDTSNVTNMDYAFSYSIFADLIGIGDISTNSLNSIKCIFGYSYINNDTYNYVLDLNKWDVSRITIMGGSYFEKDSDDYYEDTYTMYDDDGMSWVINNYSSYAPFTKLTTYKLDISSWDTSNVIIMESMFAGLKVNYLDCNFNANNLKSVINVRYMFEGLGYYAYYVNTNLVLDFSKSDNLKTINGIFENNTFITNVTIKNLYDSSLNFSMIFGSYSYMYNSLSCNNLTFYNCYINSSSVNNLKGLSLITVLMKYSINSCYINVVSTSSNSLFKSMNFCSEISIANSTFSSTVTSLNSLFNSCTSLETIDISGISFESTSSINCTNMFYSLPALKTIYVSSNFSINYLNPSTSKMFYCCNNLVGGNGSTFNDLKSTDGVSVYAMYGKIDEVGSPGLFTIKS